MKKSQKIISKRLKIGILFLAGIVAAGAVLAVNPFVEIQYPVEELGNCQNREECKAFCDNPENMEPCLDFAQKIGLMSEKEAQKAKKMASVSAEMPGPGGCIGERECKAYCDKMENIRECIRFAEENDLIPPEELEQAKKVIQAMDQGLTPPNCAGKDECDVYCGRPENMEECIEFGIAAGLMPPGEQEEARKMLKAMKAGIKPPNCAGKKECDVYCQKPENMEECIEFGIAAGFMPPEEAENARKMLKALKAGIKPPNCQGDRECDAYCRKPENMGECIEFSIAAGFAPPGEEENMKRMLKAINQGILPPDCRNDEECRIYCDKEENKQQCMDFNVAAGFMTQEEAEIMKKTGGKGPGGCRGEQECKAFCDNPSNAKECIQFGVMMGDVSQEEADRMMKNMDRAEMGEGMMMGGPGGCKTKEECEAFCGKPENAQECMGPQGPPQGPGDMMSPGQGGQWTVEDEERLKQELQEEYGDEWQKIYDEKMRDREGMPPEEWREGEPYRPEPGILEGVRERTQEFTTPFFGPEEPKGPMPPEGEWKGEEGEWRGEGEWGWEEGKPEPFYPEPKPEPWQEEPGEEWYKPEPEESPGVWEEAKPMIEPFPMTQPMAPREPVPTQEPKPFMEPVPQPMPSQVQPSPTPVPQPTPAPQPAPEPVSEPAPMLEPMPPAAPAPMMEPQPPQSMLDPFKKFLGKAAEFLLGR